MAVWWAKQGMPKMGESFIETTIGHPIQSKGIFKEALLGGAAGTPPWLSLDSLDSLGVAKMPLDG